MAGPLNMPYYTFSVALAYNVFKSAFSDALVLEVFT